MKKLLILLIALGLVGCTSVEEVIQDEIIEEVIEEPKIPEPEVTTLMFGGDNLIHSMIYKNALQSDGTYDFTSVYENISEYFIEADIAMINQETVINNAYAPSTYPQFSTPLEMEQALVGIGIDIITVANNHVFDKGATGIENSLEYFRDNSPIQVVGAYLDEEDYSNIRTIEENDTVFSFIGATESTNGLYIKNSDVVLQWSTDEEGLLARIEQAREISDVVVVNVHWGNEYVIEPTAIQKSLAVKMIDAGADIIIGHHPHVLQRAQTIVTEAGNEGFVAYSLGNLMSTQDAKPRVIGGLMDIEVTKYYDKDEPYVEITKTELIPIITHYTYGRKNIQAIPLSSYTDEMAKTHALYDGNFSLKYINEHIEKSMAIPE